MTEPARHAAAALLALGLAACGGASPPEGHATRAREEAVVRSGGVTVRASVVPTMAMGETVAREYDVERHPRSLLLMVGVRRGADARQETAVPATVIANAIDLRGVRQAIPLREVAVGELTDHVGVVRMTPPETLRFHIEVQAGDDRPVILQFSRDFYPQRP